MTFITHEELCSEEIELLPARETLAMWSWGNHNWANVSATNVALASNNSFFGGAWASANQAVYVSQH